MILIGLTLVINGRKFVDKLFGFIVGVVSTGLLFSMCALAVSGKKKWMFWAALVVCIVVGITLGYLAYKHL